jgi:predicted CoA-substrate-specific enzyme activase
MVLGCDIGTSITKAVVLRDGKFIGFVRTATEANPDRALEKVLEQIHLRTGLKTEDVGEIIVTGWGQGRVSFPHTTQATMNCLARAAVWDLPTCRSVLCIGAQQSVVLSVKEKGRVLDYRMNDKCAAGAGKFLEVIFEALDCRLEDSAHVAGAARKKLAVTSQCAVFAESEVVSLVNDGESVSDIAGAIFEALSKSITTLCKKIRVKADFVIGGGIANNSRIVETLEDGLGKPMHVFRPEPDLIAAVGAALSAGGVDA